jgi:type I restriction enzyme R subunit
MTHIPDIIPNFREDQSSQIPALQVLQNLGWEYLTLEEALQLRENKKSKVLLEKILTQQLKKINQNRIQFRGKSYSFSENNLQSAIQSLQLTLADGLIRSNEKLSDLLTLGKSLEETMEGNTKSYNLRYIDWEDIQNNVFHVTAEYEVERVNSHQTRKPDIVLFINGIPVVVIECKRPDLKKEDPLEQAISQNIRNQKEDEIPHLFLYSQLLLALAVNSARYGTTGTPSKFWSKWIEKEGDENFLHKLINTPLKTSQKEKLFSAPFQEYREYFEELEKAGNRERTEQDLLLYALCRRERLLELIYQFIVFDAGEKKIARYQQYFAIKETLKRITTRTPQEKRNGGVIWHTQGSGKSLTMVMLSKAIALEPSIKNPKIVLVTDRINLDEQIAKIFKSCGKTPEKARTGKHLMELVASHKEAMITTVIDKFDAVAKSNIQNDSKDIFVLVDESHRSQYGFSHAKMRKVFPHACYLGFTGTPLKKKDKNTIEKFGGIIDAYTINQAVQDKAVVPLLYEGRSAIQEVSKKSMDTWFERVTKNLTDKQKKDLKKKFSRKEALNQAEQKIYQIAYDITDHYCNTFQGTGFKGQLTAPSKSVAIKYKKYFDELGKVKTEVLISPPDLREGHEDIHEEDLKGEVETFWKTMMKKFKNEGIYNREIIEKFKNNGEDPEIIIVVDKLLTGFDAPKNKVLYLTRSLKEHTLLQAIARVNRLAEGKEFGYIIDYYGVLLELDKALTEYGNFGDYDPKDLEGSAVGVQAEVKKLPQKYSDVWDIFKTIQNKQDIESYERFLGDEEVRQEFYERLSKFIRILKIALSTVEFHENTPESKRNKYREDVKFFSNLRTSVQKRFSEIVDYKEFEPQIKKLLDTYISSDEIEHITSLVNIFEEEAFHKEIAKLVSLRAKAETIASRTKKTITEKMEEDPVFYSKFSKLLEEAIENYREGRLSEAEYVEAVSKAMENVRQHREDGLPEALKNRDVAIAFYHVSKEVLEKRDEFKGDSKAISAEIGLKIDDLIQSHLIVDWRRDEDIKNAMKNDIEDFLVELREKQKLGLSFSEIDSIMEQSLRIAESSYSDVK